MKYPLLSGMDLAVVDSPVKYIPYVWRKAKRYILQKRPPQKVEICIGDYMLRRDKLTFLQFGIATLCLDIDKYLKTGDASFYYQNVGKAKWYGKDYDTTDDNLSFKKTIDSIVEKGYESDSYIELDWDLSIQNGTHRTAILLCLHQYKLTGLRYAYCWYYFKDAEHYVRHMNFDKKYVNEVINNYEAIEKDLVERGATFALWIQKDSSLDGLMNDKNIRFLKKIPLKNDSVYYQFAFVNPKYRVEGNTLISCAAENMIKKLQRKGIINYRVARNCSEGMEMYNEMIK